MSSVVLTGVPRLRRARCPRPAAFEVHLVDGTYELFRHHFAVPSHLDDDGMEVAATRGVLGSVLGMLEQGATHVGVATDHVVESFRNDLWLGLQDERGHGPGAAGPVPDARGRPAGARGHGLGDGRGRGRRRRWPRRRGSPATTHASNAAFICTPDKDLGQCVEDPKVLQLDRRQDRRARRSRGAGALRRRPALDPRLPRAGRRHRRRLPRAAGLGREVDRHRARPLRAPRRDPRRREGVGGRGARRGQARGDARRPRAKPPSCSSTSPRCASTPTSARSTTGSGAAPTPELDGVGDAARRRRTSWRGPSASRRSGSADRRGRAMETIELAVGPYRYRALADGPADGDLVLLLHGFPETSYEWRAPARGARVRPATGRSRPTSAATRRGARPAALDEYHVDHSSPTCSGSPTRSGSTRFHLVGHDWGGFVAWYTAAVRSRRPAAHADRRVHPAPGAVPRRHARAGATSASARATWTGSARRDAEATFLADDARAPRRRLRRAPADAARRVPPGVHRRRRRRAHRRAQLVPRQRLRRAGRADHRADAVRVVDRRRRARPRGGRGHRRGGRRARTASRCSTA